MEALKGYDTSSVQFLKDYKNEPILHTGAKGIVVGYDDWGTNTRAIVLIERLNGCVKIRCNIGESVYFPQGVNVTPGDIVKVDVGQVQRKTPLGTSFYYGELKRMECSLSDGNHFPVSNEEGTDAIAIDDDTGYYDFDLLRFFMTRRRTVRIKTVGAEHCKGTIKAISSAELGGEKYVTFEEHLAPDGIRGEDYCIEAYYTFFPPSFEIGEELYFIKLPWKRKRINRKIPCIYVVDWASFDQISEQQYDNFCKGQRQIDDFSSFDAMSSLQTSMEAQTLTVDSTTIIASTTHSSHPHVFSTRLIEQKEVEPSPYGAVIWTDVLQGKQRQLNLNVYHAMVAEQDTVNFTVTLISGFWSYGTCLECTYSHINVPIGIGTVCDVQVSTNAIPKRVSAQCKIYEGQILQVFSKYECSVTQLKFVEDRLRISIFTGFVTRQVNDLIWVKIITTSKFQKACEEKFRELQKGKSSFVVTSAALVDVEERCCQIANYEEQRDFEFAASRCTAKSLKWNWLKFYVVGDIRNTAEVSITGLDQIKDERMNESFFYSTNVHNQQEISKTNLKWINYFKGSYRMDIGTAKPRLQKLKYIKRIQIYDLENIDWRNLVLALGLPERLSDKYRDEHVHVVERKTVQAPATEDSDAKSIITDLD